MIPATGKLADWLWRFDAPWWLGVRLRGGRRFQRRWFSDDDITDDLAASGVRIEPYRIDVDAFWRYVEASGYPDLSYFGGGGPLATEKWLEHFISIDLGRLRPGEVVIDVASRHSPFPDVVRRCYGARCLRQDLIFPPGLQDDDTIGGDAAALPLEDGFADLLTLHCSFEHFEGDTDSRFLREAGRLLKPGGRLCVLPLYTSDTYSIQTDPATWASCDVRFESDALICLMRGRGECHGRAYDAEHFLSRLVAHQGDLQPTIYRVENRHEVRPEIYLRFVALWEKPG